MTYKEQMRKWAKRRQKIVKLRQDGRTMQYIADRYGITKQRVKQILQLEKSDDQ